jgi:aminopeptidase
MDEKTLRNYAHLIVTVGAAVKKGQAVIIRTDVNNEEFATIVAEECYKAGASRIVYEWKSAPLAKVDYQYGNVEVLGHMSPTAFAITKYQAEELPAFIWLDNDDPDGLKGVDALRKSRTSRRRNYGEVPPSTSRKPRTVINGPSLVAMARNGPRRCSRLLSEEKAKEALWEAILKTSRADKGDPVKNWDEHEKDLKSPLRLSQLPQSPQASLHGQQRHRSHRRPHPVSHFPRRWRERPSRRFLPTEHPKRGVLHFPDARRGGRHRLCFEAFGISRAAD